MIKVENIKPLHANWPIQAYHYLKIIFFGFQKSSHNWSCKGSAFPNQSWRKPFWRSANFVMIDYNMKGKYNLSQHSDMTFTPNGRGVLHLLDATSRSWPLFFFFLPNDNPSETTKNVFSSKKFFLLWRYLNFCIFSPSTLSRLEVTNESGIIYDLIN